MGSPLGRCGFLERKEGPVHVRIGEEWDVEVLYQIWAEIRDNSDHLLSIHKHVLGWLGDGNCVMRKPEKISGGREVGVKIYPNGTDDYIIDFKVVEER
jgi:hypothetical protein